MLSPIKIEKCCEWRADARGKQRGVEKINKKLFHGVGPGWLLMDLL
jgi:hypothetical protein